jgi:hypothetical protein
MARYRIDGTQELRGQSKASLWGTEEQPASDYPTTQSLKASTLTALGLLNISLTQCRPRKLLIDACLYDNFI